jgi:CRISPR-associated protein Csx17
VNEVVLGGCRPEPLAAYLKALGVLRIVGEQLDGGATGHWRGDRFVLTSSHDLDDLVDFLLDEYVPTPMVAPWNRGSGFTRAKNKKAADALERIEGSEEPRLAIYREVISRCRLLREPLKSRLTSESKTVTEKAKAELAERCRAELPDAFVRWIDAAAVLAGAKLTYPPTLGTGGNVGRADLTVGFMESVAAVLGLSGRRSSREDAGAWLLASLTGTGTPSLLDGTLSQYDPGAAGFNASSARGEEKGLLNPWDYVLLLEGAVVLASGAARRLGSKVSGRAAIPFTVAAASPSIGAADAATKSESWLPMWGQPATYAEIDRLFGEGRAEWRGRTVTNGVDFARAIRSLGVDRGIREFTRFAFVERMGRSNAAVPIARVAVAEQRSVLVTAQLDGWLARVRRIEEPPASLGSALRRVDAALFDVARSGRVQTFQDLLVATADLESALGRAERVRSKQNVAPLNTLRAVDWLDHLVVRR